MLFTKKELIVLFNENNLKQPKAKYSNNIILKMLENVSEDFQAFFQDCSCQTFL